MKLTPAQRAFLQEVASGPPNNGSISIYKPAIRLAELGLIEKIGDESDYCHWKITDAGKEATLGMSLGQAMIAWGTRPEEEREFALRCMQDLVEQWGTDALRAAAAIMREVEKGSKK